MNSSVIRIRCQKKGPKGSRHEWLTHETISFDNPNGNRTKKHWAYAYIRHIGTSIQSLKMELQFAQGFCTCGKSQFSESVDLTLRLGKDREGLWKTVEIGRRELPGLVANVRLWVPGVHYEVQRMEEIRQRHRKGTDAGTLWHVSVAWRFRNGTRGLARSSWELMW